MKTLNEQYQLIKEGKGHKGVFLNEAKRQFPNYIRNAATFEETATILKQRGVINENLIGITPVNTIEPSKKESFELAFEKFLEEAKDPQIKAKEVKGKTVKSQEEDEKAELKKPSKQVEEDNKHGYDHSDKKNLDNVIYGQMMKGYYTEMKDPKNEDKTMEQIRDIVLKNLEKDPMHYVKDGQFGVKGVGYQTEVPGLGTPKEPTGKYKASGYGDLKENLGYYMEPNPHRMDPKDIEDYSKEIEGMSKAEAIEYLLNQGLSSSMIKKVISSLNTDIRDMFDQDPDVRIDTPEDIYESAVRKIVRAIINEELEEVRGGGNYGMMTINTHGGEGGGKRFIPKQLPFPVNIKKRFGDHMVYNPGNGTFYISDVLYNNLVKGYADQPAIKKLISDIPPMVKQLLTKPDNYSPTVNLNSQLPDNLKKQFNLYHPLNAKVEKAKEDKFNKAGDKQYWSAGDFLFPNLNVMEEEVTETLKESIEKELAAINKEAEAETMQIKLDKINDAIEKRKSQLTKLDEDEDMKNLTDKKKVKELEKDIKKLEQAKSKVEKLMSKGKGKKKEVIEDGAEDPMMDEIEVDETQMFAGKTAISKLSNNPAFNALSQDGKKTVTDKLNAGGAVELEEEDEEESEY